MIVCSFCSQAQRGAEVLSALLRGSEIDSRAAVCQTLDRHHWIRSVAPYSCAIRTMNDCSRLTFRTEPTLHDAAAIEQLVAKTGFFTLEEVAIARELVDERLTKGAASGYEFILAEQNGRLVGYSCYGHIAGTEHSYDLYWIAVAPEQQRSGIGRKILAETEAVIGRKTKARIYIETSGKPQYQPTQSFYEKNGYVLEARMIDFYRDGDDKLVYVKVIRQSNPE